MAESASPVSKIMIVKGATTDLSKATYQIHDETHTLGDPLRRMLIRNPKVEFCGYNLPHPSDNFILIRIQMYDNLSSLTALINALSDLDQLYKSIYDAYFSSLENDEYERWQEKS